MLNYVPNLGINVVFAVRTHVEDCDLRTQSCRHCTIHLIACSHQLFG